MIALRVASTPKNQPREGLDGIQDRIPHCASFPSGEPWDDIMRESPGDDRLDAHNTSVDEELAEKHVCAQVHLQTGRVCVLPAAHPGGCDFQRVNIPDSSREQASE